MGQNPDTFLNSQADFAFLNKILNYNKWQVQNTGHKGRSLHALIKNGDRHAVSP